MGAHWAPKVLNPCLQVIWVIKKSKGTQITWDTKFLNMSLSALTLLLN